MIRAPYRLGFVCDSNRKKGSWRHHNNGAFDVIRIFAMPTTTVAKKNTIVATPITIVANLINQPPPPTTDVAIFEDNHEHFNNSFV